MVELKLDIWQPGSRACAPICYKGEHKGPAQEPLSSVGRKPLKEKKEGWHPLVSESSPAIVHFDCNQIKSVNKIY